MKNVTLGILINFLLVSNVFSYAVITDPNVFYAFFEKPARVIDFTKLKDGTFYNNIPGRFESDTFKVSEPDCINNPSEDNKALTVWPNALLSSERLFMQSGSDTLKVSDSNLPGLLL